MRTLSATIALASCLLLFAACGNPPTDIDQLPVCDDGVKLSISAGADPQFSWTPECRVETLRIFGEGVFWAVTAPPNRLLSPVQYGEVPETARTLGAPDPLRQGSMYTLQLLVTRPPLAFDTVAVKTFTR